MTGGVVGLLLTGGVVEPPAGPFEIVIVNVDPGVIEDPIPGFEPIYAPLGILSWNSSLTLTVTEFRAAQA